MNLRSYLLSLPQAERTPFARRCDTSFAYLQQIGYGNRTCTTSMAMKLERESAGVLRCESLCPDFDWAFFRASSACMKG